MQACASHQKVRPSPKSEPAGKPTTKDYHYDANAEVHYAPNGTADLARQFAACFCRHPSRHRYYTISDGPPMGASLPTFPRQ